jgi:photosystem II stability/assembly factor-like uncharacterized protein
MPLRYNEHQVRIVVLLAVFLFPLSAQTPSAQTPVRVPFDCSPEQAEAFGLNCSEDEPCPVYLELASAAGVTGRVFVAGNLHTSDTTLSSLLMASEDGGATWTEPVPRLHNAALEQIEFLESQAASMIGWISGESIDPLTRNPFLLLTADGGKTWRQKPLFEEATFGAIAQFHFSSKNDGELLLDLTQGKTKRAESYITHTGGESWELQGRGPAIRLATAPRQSDWRVRADASSGSYRVEHSANAAGPRIWESVANFTIHVTDCH